MGIIVTNASVNYMPSYVKNMAQIFADDTKLYSEIKDLDDCASLQDDLNSLAAWSRKWLLGFNETKCVVLKIKESFNYLYTLNGHFLDSVAEQKDLGVYITNDLKPSTHISKIVKKANQRLGLIKRCFTDLTPSKVKLLYQGIVRPILEYGSPAWNPHLQKYITTLQKVQDRCSRLCYPPLTLPPLADRREQADLCETYKYTHDLYKADESVLFSRAPLQLRGHRYKLFKEFAHTNVRKFFFSNRVVDRWNALPEEVVNVETLASFKRNLRSLAEC